MYFVAGYASDLVASESLLARFLMCFALSRFFFFCGRRPFAFTLSKEYRQILTRPPKATMIEVVKEAALSHVGSLSSLIHI